MRDHRRRREAVVDGHVRPAERIPRSSVLAVATSLDSRGRRSEAAKTIEDGLRLVDFATRRYGRPNTQLTKWEGGALRTVFDSAQGHVEATRAIKGDRMVMALTSPSKVVAYRYFDRVGAGGAAAASDATGGSVVPLALGCAGVGFVAGRMTASPPRS